MTEGKLRFKFLALFAIAFSAIQTCKSVGADFIFPRGAGVVSVLDYGAIPGDGKDDTAAIQAALDAFPAGHRIIYLPDGAYEIRDTLRWPQGTVEGQIMKFTTLQGQSTAGVVLHVADGCPGFNDPAKGRAVIFTGPQPAQRFGNQVRNLTIDTGKNNPGAIGLQFNASNYGCVRDVRIVSEDGQGLIGLDMAFTGEIGPLLVKGLYVKGYDVGIKTLENEASQTIEDVVLEGQRKYGIHNKHQSIFVRHLKSTNSVPAVYNEEQSGLVTLTDSELIGTGDAANGPAVIHEKTTKTFLRNVKTTGYKVAVDDREAGKTIDGPNVDEWASGETKQLFASTGRSLHIPMEETPALPFDPDMSHWANPADFGATAGDQSDDTVAIQKAIDSGATTIWFPSGQGGGEGEYRVEGVLKVRGNVQRLIGYTGRLNGAGVVRFETGTAPLVVAERMSFGFFGSVRVEVASDNDVAILDSSIDKGLTHTGKGKLFLEDVVSSGRFTFKGGPVFAHAINPEVPGTHVLVDGARVLIHGMKVEVKGTIVEARNHAALEMLGLFIYASHVLDKSPMAIVDESDFSINYREKTNFAESYPVLVRETRGGDTREWSNPKGGGSGVALFVAVPQKVDNPPAGAADVQAAPLSPSEVTVTWKDASTNEDGFVIERSAGGSDSWIEAGRVPLDVTKFTDHALAFDSEFSYRVRAVNAAGMSGPLPGAKTRTPANTQAPAAPSNLVAATPRSGEIVLDWKDNSNNESKFVIERSSNGSEWAEVTSVATDVTHHVITGLPEKSAAHYRVRAVNPIGASEPTGAVAVTTLPDNLQADDINNPTLAGRTTFDAGTGAIHVEGGGIEIWNASDQFHFVHREVSGDLTVTARVASFTNGEYYAKAGVMIRASLAPESAFACMAVKPDNIVYFSSRPSDGAMAVQDQGLDSGNGAKWVRLVRGGGSVRGFYSVAEKPTDKDWKELGQVMPVAFNDPVQVGLAVSSQSDQKFGVAAFEGFEVQNRAVVALRPVTPPQQAIATSATPVPAVERPKLPTTRAAQGDLPKDWVALDIGGPGGPGHAAYDAADDKFTVRGGGADIWGPLDSFLFTCKDLTGDATFITRMEAMDDAGTFAKAGIMFRASDAADAAFAYVMRKPDGQVNFSWRPATGKDATQSGWTNAGNAAIWLKLVRSGDHLSGAFSIDGKEWMPIGEPIEVSLPDAFKAGFAVTATSLDGTVSASFSHARVQSVR